MHARHLRSSSLLLVLALTACNRQPPTDPRMVSEWVNRLYGAVRVERVSPVVASRIYAYTSLGLYAGLAAATPDLPRLDGKLNGLDSLPKKGNERVDPTLTALASERVLVDSIFRDGLPTTRASLRQLADSLLAARIATGIDSAEQARSADLGTRTGVALLRWMHADGFDTTRGRKYAPPVGPGLWANDSPIDTYASQNLSGATQLVVPANPTNAFKPGAADDRGLILDRQKRQNPTLPAVNMAGVTEPYWGHNRPFVLTSWDACQVPIPPVYGTTPGTPLYEQAKAVHDASMALTPEQRTIALYWADNGGESGTPAGHWLSIASQMVSERHLTGEQAAWLMAQTGTALADAFIATWGYKFRFNVVRPRPLIRATMDSTWEPAIATPPFPEYMSGHSTISAAAAGALTGLLGASAFDDSTVISIGHEVRHFASFRAAADEAGLSRIYGGIHYPVSNEQGGMLGRCVAAAVLSRFGKGPLP